MGLFLSARKSSPGITKPRFPIISINCQLSWQAKKVGAKTGHGPGTIEGTGCLPTDRLHTVFLYNFHHWNALSMIPIRWPISCINAFDILILIFMMRRNNAFCKTNPPIDNNPSHRGNQFYCFGFDRLPIPSVAATAAPADGSRLEAFIRDPCSVYLPRQRRSPRSCRGYCQASL